MGAVWHQAGCCCGRCQYCQAGTTPEDILVTISAFDGVDADSTCVNHWYYGDHRYTPVWKDTGALSGTLNGAHLLLPTISCYWEKSYTILSGEMEIHSWEDYDCIGDPDVIYNIGPGVLLLRAIRGAGNFWGFNARYQSDELDGVGGHRFRVDWFSSSAESTDTDCQDSVVANNTYVNSTLWVNKWSSADPEDWSIGFYQDGVAYTGSATIEPGDPI